MYNDATIYYCHYHNINNNANNSVYFINLNIR